MNIRQHLQTQWRRKIVLPLVGAAILCIGMSATILAVNFSGEWTLNEGKSQIGQMRFGAAKAIKVISSDANSISFERVSTNQNGEDVVRKEEHKFDGKEVEVAGGFGNSKRKVSAKWSDDGQAMLINANTSFERDGQTMEFKQKETWKLADGGKTLVIESATSSQMGDNTMKLVYEKK